MNKKNAFTVAVQLQRKMAWLKAVNYTNAMLVGNNFWEAIGSISLNYGMSIQS